MVIVYFFYTPTSAMASETKSSPGQGYIKSPRKFLRLKATPSRCFAVSFLFYHPKSLLPIKVNARLIDNL